jgi:poly(A) polymerase
VENIIRKISGLSEGFEVYAVGGFLRDMLLKRGCKDVDLTVDKNALKYSKRIANAFKAKLVVLDRADKTYRIILKESAVVNIDVSQFKGGTIEQDLRSRDFTVNAAAFNLNDFENFRRHIISPCRSAARDLKSKTINTVSDGVFKADPLRMLRAFRFAAELGFKISQKTLMQIKQDAKLICTAAPERVKNEFFGILSSENATELVGCMDGCGLISEIFCEIKAMKKSRGKYYYHPGGLFQHSFEAMEATENILNNLEKYFPENYTDIRKHFEDGGFSENVTRKNLLKFSALFHDNAKPETAKFQDGKMHFFGHEERGAEKIKKIMSSLKFGIKDTKTAMFLIRHHMRPSSLTRNNPVTKKATLKFFRDIGDNTPDLIVLSMADWRSYKKLGFFSLSGLRSQEKAARKLLKYYYELKNAKPLQKIIDGNIVMKRFGLKPGPWIGELLDYAVEAQWQDRIFTTDEALKTVFSKLTHIKKKYKI